MKVEKQNQIPPAQSKAKVSIRRGGVQGVSLIELMIVVLLTGILMLGISKLITLTVSQNETVAQKIRLESNIYEMSFYLRHILSQAVNLEYISDPAYSLNNRNSRTIAGDFAPNIGKIRTYDFASIFNPVANDRTADTIAYFLRESWNSAAPHVDPGTGLPLTAGAQRFLPTGIFFQKPTITTFGVFFIDQGENGNLAPAANNLRFENIVDLKVVEPEVYAYDWSDPDSKVAPAAVYTTKHPVASVAFKIVVREYSDYDSTSMDFKWCPPTFMVTTAACRTTSHYADVEKVVRVVFRDNIIGRSSVQASLNDIARFPLPPTGGTKNRIVPMDRRPFEMIYFYKTNFQNALVK